MFFYVLKLQTNQTDKNKIFNKKDFVEEIWNKVKLKSKRKTIKIFSFQNLENKINNFQVA